MKNKEAVQWGWQYLSSHGYILKKKSPENVQDTPWSCVVCFLTSQGSIYLKHMPALLALESKILQILKEQFHISVPNVIADNPQLNCFLMQDAGNPLREILKHKFDVDLFCRAIEQFTAMQLVVADHVNAFLDVGIPDWRLDKLPDLYMRLLAQKEMLLADGLSGKEIIELENLFPTVSNLCQKLSAYAINPSIVQPDFNDNNTLVAKQSQDITIIDLGEIAISHPFFSLVNCLHQAKKHYALTEEDDVYRQLIGACLKNYITVAPKNNLLDALSLAKQLWFVYGALASDRLKRACDKESFTGAFQRHGRPSTPLKEFLELNRHSMGFSNDIV